MEEGLYHTTMEADSGPGYQEGLQHFRDDSGCVPDLKERKVAQEEIHWGLELLADSHDDDDEAVPCQGENVYDKDEYKQ